jgi:hypothetical protein
LGGGVNKGEGKTLRGKTKGMILKDKVGKDYHLERRLKRMMFFNSLALLVVWV